MGLVGYKNFGFVPNEAFGHGAEDEASPRIRGKYVHMTLEGVAGAEQEKVFGEPRSTDFLFRQENRKRPEKKEVATKKIIGMFPGTTDFVATAYINGGIDSVVKCFLSRQYATNPAGIATAVIDFAGKMRVYNPRVSRDVLAKLAKEAVLEKTAFEPVISSLFSAETKVRLIKEAKKNVGPATRLLKLLS